MPGSPFRLYAIALSIRHTPPCQDSILYALHLIQRRIVAGALLLRSLFPLLDSIGLFADDVFEVNPLLAERVVSGFELYEPALVV